MGAGKAGQAGKGARPVSLTQCGDLLLVEPGASVSEFDFLGQVYTLEDLLSNDPKKNIALRHPSIVWNAYQKAWAIINHYGHRTILEPDFRVEQVNLWNAFATPVSPNGPQIFGQYVPVDNVVTFLREGASGSSPAKVLSLTGPAGTGKTELLKVLHLRRAILSYENPDFWEFRFRWKNLKDIPSLEPLQDPTQQDEPFYHQMGRSPIVLLTKEMQKAVVELATPAAERLTGFEPHPFLIRDPHTKEIIERIIAFYYPGKAPTQMEYLSAISRHVEIYRFVVDPDQPPVFVRNQGRNIDWSNLFMAEDPARKLVYGVGNPLSYDYSGLILQADGFGAFFDEFFRQIVSFRDATLEFSQNRVVQRGGAKAVTVDAFAILADNDESKDKAKDEGAAGAQLDRGANLPMRLTINPYQNAKVILAMAMQEWGPGKFTMTDLSKKNAKPEPADVNVIFPEVDDNSKFPDIDGRYSIHCKLGSGQNVLVAPRTLFLLGATAAATRLVTSPSSLVKFVSEFDILGNNSNEFTSPVTRLQVILGQLPASDALRTELNKVKDLLNEGSEGISARSSQTWFLAALARAGRNESTLTPALANAVFEKLMDRKDFLNKTMDVRAQWISLNNQVKAGLLLPALTSDVLTLLSQRTDVDSLYAEIEAELITLFQNQDAQKRDATGNNNLVDIEFDRLDKIKKSYKDLTGRSLEPGEVASFKLVPGRKPEDRHPGLLNAIQTWLYRTEISANALDQYLHYFETATGPETVRRAADRAKSEMTQHGYNQRALLEAISMARDLMRDQERREGDK